MFEKKTLRALISAVLAVFASACSNINLGVETGNPNGRIIQGKFDDAGESDSASSALTYGGLPRLTNLSSSCNNPGILEVEARATDLSDKVRATISNDRFEVTVDPEKTYVFVIFGDDEPCGYVIFDQVDDIATDRPERAIVGPGTEDVDLGTLIQYSDTFVMAWAASDNPATASDIDGDGTADASDDDVNGDGILDFDGNYDGFINVEDPSDTDIPTACDILTMQGSELAEVGTVTKNATAELVLTFTQGVAAFDASEATLNDVDTEEETPLFSAAEVTTDGDNAIVSLNVTSDHDYLITFPIGSFSCNDGSEQTREISHYFRVVDTGIACSPDLDC